MIDAYQRFHLKYQIAAIAGLTVLAFFIGWMQEHQPFVVASFVLAGLILLHVFLTKLNSLLAFIVIIIQAAILLGLILGVYAYGLQVASLLTIDVNLVALMIASFGLTMIASYIYMGYRFSQGRLWANLTISFTLSGLTAAMILLINPAFYVTALLVGYITGAAYLLLRVPRKKKKPIVEKNALSSSVKKKVQHLLSENGLEFTLLTSNSDLSGGHYLARNEHALFLINVAVPTKSFSITSRGVLCDDTNLIPLLAHGQEELNKQHKMIKSEWVTPVLLVVSDSKHIKPITAVRIAKWKQPDHMLSVTNIVTPEGFSRLVRAYNDRMGSWKPKQVEKITFFTQKLDSSH
jgi:hypothetical protein